MSTRTKRRSTRKHKGTRTATAAAGRKGSTQGSDTTSRTGAASQSAQPDEPKGRPQPTASAHGPRPGAAGTNDGGTGLPEAVAAQRHEHIGVDGIRVSYYVDGPESNRPLLLVHAINAAPSVWELKPLFEHYRTHRRVYAIDLPGFGFSERSKRRYSPALYIQTIVDFAVRVIGKPVDVIALSLGSEFTVGAALREPDHFRSLTLISPTGFSSRRLPDGQGPVAKWLHRILSVPLWAPGLFNLLTTRKSIRYFMNKSFVGEVPAEYIDYAYAAAHQPGAHHAPLYFLSGQLFTTDAYEQLYAKLTQPVLVIHDRDPNVSFDRLPELVASRANWQEARVAPSLGLPHWERLGETAAAIDRFWTAHGAKQAAGTEQGDDGDTTARTPSAD